MREFAVILAGGSGSRMRGSVSDKVLVPLFGKPVIMHSFGAFVESGRVGKVVFACRDSSQQAAIESAIEKYFSGSRNLSQQSFQFPPEDVRFLFPQIKRDGPGRKQRLQIAFF